MELQSKTLEKLRDLLNEETEYRSGPKLVDFFNKLGFNDSYGQGFPSRWRYTDDKLANINGTPQIDICIKSLFAPVNFIGEIDKLDNHIKDFNQYMVFDGWMVKRENTEVTITRAGKVNLGSSEDSIKNEEEEFLNKEFEEISLEKLGIDGVVIDILKLRITEIKNCLNSKSPLATIFLAGSTLEGILSGFVNKYPRDYNQAQSSPKDQDGKVKKLHEWTLNNYINVAYELGHINADVKKFSHALRDFRNYIHPYQQMSERFNPDDQTAKICWQVLKAAIFQLEKVK